jgi:hypothetical protein
VSYQIEIGHNFIRVEKTILSNKTNTVFIVGAVVLICVGYGYEEYKKWKKENK